MRLSSFLSSVVFSVVAMVAVACGGPDDSPPGPLGNHMDDMYIAAVAMDQKTQVSQTQADWSTAKMENAKAEADYNDVSGAKLSVARNEHQSAKLQINSAIENKKAAEASGDMNRVNAAQADVHKAELLEKAAAARVRYFEAYRDFLKVHWRFTQENMYWREAQYEQAKVELAQKNNIQPKGVNLAAFKPQTEERGNRTQSAKQKVDGARATAQNARTEWLSAQAAADSAAGKPSNLPDPMGPSSSTTIGG